MSRRVAIAILRSDPSEVWVAEDTDVLSRVIALQVVAKSPASSIADPRVLDELRRALLEERWGDAVALWIENGGAAIDVYDDVEVWSDAALDAEHASLEIRMSPIFGDPD